MWAVLIMIAGSDVKYRFIHSYVSFMRLCVHRTLYAGLSSSETYNIHNLFDCQPTDPEYSTMGEGLGVMYYIIIRLTL